MAKVKTKTLPAGKLNKRGFTLIELSVVVFLIALMLLIAVPRVRDTMFNDGLESTVNHLTNTARELRSDAVREQVDYVIHLDLDNNLFWTCSADMTPEMKNEMKKRVFQLPNGVRIADTYHFGKEKIYDGEATIKFSKKGYVKPTVIHLTQGERHFTLIFNPFSGSIKRYDRYIDFQ